MGWTTLPDGTARLDVSAFIEEMEGALRHGTDEVSRSRILATLYRWRSDGMLDEESQSRARALAMEFDALEADIGCLMRCAPAVRR